MDYQTLAKKLTTSNPKTIYDGVFSSSSHPQSSPGAIDDYREIFLGSTNTSNKESSIPFLDIPEQSKTTSVDFKNNNNKSFVDYSNVFGGFEDFDGALSYEDVIVNDKPKPKPKMKKYAATGFVSMELEPMNSASMASSLKGSDDLDSLGGNQMKSDQESYQSFVGTKQFNMPYRKTSPGLSNGANATHIAELNAVSGYTYLVDGGSHKPTTKGDKSILSGGENASSDSDLSRQMGDFNSLNKETSKTLWADANEVPSGGSVKVQNKHSQNKSSSNDSLFDACDVNSKDDLPKESPPNLQPNLGIARDDFKKSTIPKHGMPRTTGSEKTKGVFSPPDLDEEMDENSIAAAPAAALKLAIAKAQARIKIAKESKEKKGNLRSSVKPSIKDGPRSGERKETIVAYKANNMSENKAQEISGKANSWMQGFTGLWNQKATKASQVGPGSGDRMKNPDMEGPTKEAPVQRVRSIPVEHRQHTTEEQKAEKLPEPSCVRFVHADHAKQMTQSSNEYLIKEVKTNEKRTEKPVGYDKSCNLVNKISTDGKHESEPNVVHKAVGPRFSDSFKVPDVKGPTREEAHVQRSRSPEVERSRCSIEEQEIGNLTELSSLGFEEADNAMHVMQSSNKYTRNGVMMTEEKKEEPVEHGNVFVNNVCIDEQSENEHNVSDDAEWHQVHENKLNTSKEHIYIENQTMTVGITTEQEETAEKSLETSPEEEFCEKIHMLNQPIKIEMEDEHQEVREVEYTEVVEILEQIESKKEEEVAFEQVESKNYLDDAPNREQNETVSKTPCGLNSWEEITEGPYQIESETPLVFEEEEGDNNHIYAPRRSDRAEKLDLLHGQQILAGNDGDLHVMEQIENIKPAVLEDFAEDKTLEEEKENGYMLQQICQPKDNWKRETASQKGVESDTIQADINPKSGVEAKEEVCQYEYKQNFGENLSEIQGAAQRWVEADKVQADVNLKPGDEATQEVCSDQQNKQERDDDECKEDHGENFSKIQEFYVPTKTYEHVEVIPEILTRENNGTVVEVSEAPDKPMMKKVESKPVDQIKEVEEECETESADSICSATEFNKFKEQMDGVSEADLVQRQQEQCNEDSAVGNVGCESSKRTGRDRDVQVSFRQEQDQATSEERLIDHGQCMEAAQSPCMPTEILEETHSNEEIGYGDIKEKIKENHKILEETMDATQQEMEFKKQRLAKKDEAKRMEREKEKQRIAVERAMREARERAFAEARRKIMSEARERPEKIPAGTNERMFGDKATTEAKLKAERAAVERATAEARERALKKALSDKAGMGSRKQANVNEIRRTFSSTDSQHYGSVPSSSSRYSNPSNYGVPSSSERLDGVNVESAQRCKARLERHQRTAERAAKALAEKNMRDLLAQKEQQERNRLAEALDADIKRWSSGKEKNLRALLSTLQYILGPDSGWQPISLTDLVTSAAVKKAYRKSTLYVHPDKLQQRGASIQKKYICEKVFDLLKEAYNRFSAEER